MTMKQDSQFFAPEQRRTAWERFGKDHFDVVVVGGGVVGAGIALDAATRGLRVALVEARDLGSGTSSRSSKLRCISTISWPAGPGSPSNTRTAASTAPSRWPI